MAKKPTDSLSTSSQAAGGASRSPSVGGEMVEFAIACVVNGTPYTKGQKVLLNEMVADDLKRAGGILVGFGHPDEMRVADSAGGSRTTDAAPRRSEHGNSTAMAGSDSASE